MTAATELLLPSCLQKGDLIGLAAPSGPLTTDIGPGVRMLQEAGLETLASGDIDRRQDYLAGSDERRIAELHELFSNPQVKAIWAVRGGFGCTRLLAGLDYQLIRHNPKILVGFSDLTVLLNVVQRQTGLITFHGPVLSTIIRDGQTALEDCLTSLAQPRFTDIKSKQLEILRSGQAEGHLTGGNLTSLVSLLGTDYEPQWQDAILILEDINEASYKIDRLLTQLKLAGRLDQLAGIILGGFIDNDLRSINDIEVVWQRVLDLTNSQIPVWANFPISHGSPNHIIPMGTRVLMDSSTGCLKFMENSLSY
jgi:muramoyltetrapeptide carboxypeptidase